MKKASKPAGKPAAETKAEATATGTKLSAFASLRKDQTLRQNMEKARKGSVSQDYDGPDGDLQCTFVRVGEGEKDGVQWRTVEFKVAMEGEYNGKRVSRFFSFEDGKYRTKAEVLGDFFQCFVDMGLDPENLSDEELHAALEEFTKNGTLFDVRAKRGKTGYLNFYINGPSEDQSGAEPTDDAAEAEAEPEADDDEAKPSDWDGYEVGYTTVTGKGPKKVKKTVQVWVTNCDDDKGTIDLADADGNIVVEGIDFKSDDIVWPD